MKLAQATEGKDPLPRKPPRLAEFSLRFLGWVQSTKLEATTKNYYTDGWRLLAATPIVGMRLDAITADEIETLDFTGSPSTANRALRTLRRMLHKAGWNQDWRLPALTTHNPLVPGSNPGGPTKTMSTRHEGTSSSLSFSNPTLFLMIFSVLRRNLKETLILAAFGFGGWKQQ